MLRLLTLLLSSVAVCAQPVLSLNDPTVVAKSSSLLQGLVGYWQLEESSGTRYDRSPNGNHLTAVNSPGRAAGKVGDAVSMKASSSQYLTGATNIYNFNGESKFSVSFWCYLTNNSTFQRLIGKEKLSQNTGWVVYLHTDSTVRAWIHSAYGSLLTSGKSSIANQQWNHVVVTYNGTFSNTSLMYWLNNSTNDIASITTSGNGNFTTDAPFSIGAMDNISSYTANGLIDEVGIWNRVLSNSEILQLYRSGLGVTYPRFSMRDNRADDFDFDTWEPIYDKPKPFPTLYAFVNRREPEPLLTICE